MKKTLKTLKVDYDTPLEQQLKDLGIRNWLNLDLVTNLHDRPKDDTLYDVEDGAGMRNVSPLDAREKFTKEGRRGLTIHEGLALIRENPALLKDHFIDLVGSRCRQRSVPYVYVSGGKPALYDDFEDDAGPGWGAPSCGSAIELRASEPGSESGLGVFESRVLEERFKEYINTRQAEAFIAKELLVFIQAEKELSKQEGLKENFTVLDQKFNEFLKSGSSQSEEILQQVREEAYKEITEWARENYFRVNTDASWDAVRLSDLITRLTPKPKEPNNHE